MLNGGDQGFYSQCRLMDRALPGLGVQFSFVAVHIKILYTTVKLEGAMYQNKDRCETKNKKKYPQASVLSEI